MTSKACVMYVSDDPELSPTDLDASESSLSIISVPSASAALTRLDDDIDAIVSEYNLPCIDGVQFLQRVRAEDETLPFVLYAVSGSEAIASDAISAGVTEYVRPESTDEESLAETLVDIGEQDGPEHSGDEMVQPSALFSVLLGTLPVGIIVETSDREILTINEQMLDLCSIDADPTEVIGTDCARLAERGSSHFSDPETVFETIERLVESDTKQHGTEVPLTDGRTLEQHYRSIDVPESGSHLWMYRDITDHVVRKRELERQNERLDEFASIVSHDLRNPLSVLDASLELAAETGDPEEFDRCRRAVTRMDDLISDLLTLARSGERLAETERVELSTVADAAWKTIDSPEADLQSTTDHELEADVSRLTELFENLFRNAIEHGHDDVTVMVGDCSDGFYVADDGPGIPADRRDDIFRHGYSTADDGTGFGLNIVEQIAEAHGWTITVTDSESGGARFEFRTL